MYMAVLDKEFVIKFYRIFPFLEFRKGNFFLPCCKERRLPSGRNTSFLALTFVPVRIDRTTSCVYENVSFIKLLQKKRNIGGRNHYYRRDLVRQS